MKAFFCGQGDMSAISGVAGRLDGVGTEDAVSTASRNVADPLPPVVKSRLGTLRQVCREKNVAIYEGPRKGEYEVVIIRVEKARMIAGKPYPEREIYPKPDQWGTYGWTYTKNSHPNALAAAQARMRTCLDRLEIQQRSI
jgi:hypothetical protein